MGRLDTYYRAFVDFRKNTREDRDCAALRRVFARADADGDKIEVVKTVCHIEDDWIEAIEEGLVHIGKAIDEERQFIRSNGEVVPIEKVRTVSRESVEHLARHSNLLTKEPEAGSDIIPDQLYTVERLSDYAVYENRFLYMLLCYLRDFITFRYEKITALANTYEGGMHMKKTAVGDGRKTQLEVTLREVITDDPFLSENNPAKEKIGRISDNLKNVMVYLATPLMEQVSKSPMLKPPITETNVLKMNKNFRGAVKLYYYITAYDRDGFSIERTVKKISPWNDLLADEMAETVALTSFLTYEHGMEIGDYLKARYRVEEQRRRMLEEERHREQIEKLRRRVRESGESPEEYMLMLEQRNRMLEADSAQLKAARAEIERLTQTLQEQTEQIAQLTLTVEDKMRELEEQETRHKEETQALVAAHEQEILDLNTRHAEEMQALRAQHEEEMQALRAQHEEELAALRTRQEEELSALRARHEEETEALRGEASARYAEYEERLAQTARQNEESRRSLADAETRAQQFEEQRTLIAAKYNALRREYGLFTPSDDFTTAESFGEIERQYRLFTKFFKEEWKKTRKRIRKEVFAEARREAPVQTGRAAPPAQEAGGAQAEEKGLQAEDGAQAEPQRAEHDNGGQK